MSPPFVNTAKNFRAGNIAAYVHSWAQLSSDPWIVDTVQGVTIPLEQEPFQEGIPFPYRLSEWERVAMDGEVAKLLKKGVIERVCPVQGEVISNVFLRPKANGEFRLILDLSEMNKAVEYEHFKMTSLQTAIQLMRPNCWMGSIDLKDAYYSVLVRPEHRKFLRFLWRDQLFQFLGMPNGLACAPRVFTKLLKPVFAELREEGVECFPYIDDSLVVADSPGVCKEGLDKLSQRLDSLGLVVHQEKSVFVPSQELVFLGFRLDSRTMTVSLPEDKVEKFGRAAQDLLGDANPKIRQVAGLIGLMVAYSSAVEYGGAHMKWLEWDKNKALEREKGSFEGRMQISPRAREEIFWWLENLGRERLIRLDSPSVELRTDASLEGWGAHKGSLATGGRWKQAEAEAHINVLELKAILFGLQSLCQEEGQHIRVLTDNTTALAYVKNMGGVRSEQCNEVAKDIWEWCELRGNWVTIAHIPGVHNTLADFKSRNFADNLEWQLSDKIFDKICKCFGVPEVDLFASRLTNKVETYVSFRPDPKAWRIDAFTFKWTGNLFFIFPPFSMIGRVLQKVEVDETRAILVVPTWPAQVWFATLKRLSGRRLLFRKKKGNLYNVGRPENRDLLENCPLGAYLLSVESC